MRILASHDELGCGFVRVVQPLRELAKHGHEVTFASSAETENLIKDPSRYDIIIGQRYAGYDGMSLWRRARTPQNRLVYEVDDDLFHIEKSNYAAYGMYQDPVIIEAVKGYLELADLVTVTSDILADIQKEAGAQNVAVIPNFVPEFVLDLPRVERTRPRVGWVGGGSHQADIMLCAKPVRRFLERHDNWDLYVGGTDYRPTFAARNLGQMLYGEWKQVNEHEREYYEDLDFDIGIAPVKDTVFARSKSYIKPLEYNARGIPVVVSDIEPYREYVEHGYNGFIAKTEYDWSRYLRMLADDDDLRAEMGNNGKLKAAEHTVEGNWQRWESAYEGLFA